jgi:hypothetical protein
MLSHGSRARRNAPPEQQSPSAGHPGRITAASLQQIKNRCTTRLHPHDAAKGSNLPSGGLPRPAGFEVSHFCSIDHGQPGSDRFCDLLGRRPAAEADDPVRQLAVRRVHAVAVDLQKRERRHQRCPLVPIDERLGLGDPVGKDRRLQREVRLLVVGVARRRPREPSSASRLRKWSAACSEVPLTITALDLERVFEGQIDEFVGLATLRGHAATPASCRRRGRNWRGCPSLPDAR